MFHSATINGKNTWDDYHMVPVNGLLIPPAPDKKITTIDLKTGNGVLDVSTLLTGFPLYQNRVSEFEFYILEPWEIPDYDQSYTPPSTAKSSYEIYSDILNDLHGVVGTMTLEDDPGWEYYGQFSITSYETEGNPRRVVSLGYELNPYKVNPTPSTVTINGIGASAWNIVTLTASELDNMPLTPTITVTGEFNAETVEIKVIKPPYSNPTEISKTVGAAGTYTWPDISVYKEAKFCFKGDTTKSTTWTYNKGRL